MMARNYHYEIAKIQYFKEAFVNECNESQIISFAEQLLNGELTVGDKNIECIKFDKNSIDKFDWTFESAKNANTFSLYLLGLRHIYILAEAYRLTHFEPYIKLAEDFVESFYYYFTKTEKLHGMANNDHAIAERIENLIYLYYAAAINKYKLRNEHIIINLIEDSVQKLLGEKYYQKKHNHGIIADKAALAGVYFLNNKNRKRNRSLKYWISGIKSQGLHFLNNKNKDIDYLVDRLKKQVDFAYFKDRVHKENSIDYHFSVTVMLLGCVNTLEVIGHEYCKELSEFLGKSHRFIVFALKPNGYRPLFGDSSGVPSTTKDETGKYKKQNAKVLMLGNDKQLKYVLSQGKEGEAPEEVSVIFPFAGYVFMRQNFSKENFQDATWLSLKAGYETRVHKHQDDLSICLYSKGYDIFVDSGMCGYMPKDKYKDYMESVPAHTVVGIKNKGYSIAKANGEKFKIQKFIKDLDTKNSSGNEKYDYAMASSRVYQGCAIFRHVYYLRGKDIILIKDEIHSDTEQEFVQYFNLSNYVTIKTLDKNCTVLQIGDSNYNALLKQISQVDYLRLLQGEQTAPISMLSTSFGTCEASKTLEYTKKGKNINFITMVEIVSNNDNKGRDVEVLPDEILLQQENISINIKDVEAVKYYGTELYVDGNKLCVKNLGHNYNQKFALYIFEQKSKSVIKLPYTKDEFIEYEYDGNSDIVLLYYILNETGDKIKGIIGLLGNNEDGLVIKKKYDTLYCPFVNRHYINKIKDNTFEFVVDIEYDFKLNCRWWVYYNGSKLWYCEDSNNSQVYEFVNPGVYVVMYSFVDKYFGEFVFDQFDAVTI